MQTMLPGCHDLTHAEQFSLGSGGSVLVHGDSVASVDNVASVGSVDSVASVDSVVTRHNYCLSGGLLWYCKAGLNRCDTL